MLGRFSTGAVEIVVSGDGNVEAQVRLERIIGHEWLGGTGDGGIAVVIGGVDRDGAMRYYANDWGAHEIQDFETQIADMARSLRDAENKDDTLEARCQCGGVRFSLRRPQTSAKHQACLCMCRSCRLSFGQPLTAWAMRIPMQLVVTTHQGKDAVHSGTLFGTLRRYQSSPHVFRDFCGRCGASVFFYTTERPGIVDVAMGLFGSQNGVRGKAWFEWDPDGVHSPQDAIDGELLAMATKNYGGL